MNRWLRFRLQLDRLIAVVLGVLSVPVVAAVSFLIRGKDGPPGLIRLPRIGQHGQPFRMWKLRSMRPSPGGQGPPITRTDDERITGLGRRLRRYRLDELPQLLNVVRGEMALIGPRPEAPEFVDLDDRRWTKVLETRPGIAGPTQVLVQAWEAQALGARWEEVYRHDILPTKLAIDAWYVEHASPWIDFLVLVSVVQQLLAVPLAPVVSHRVPALQGLERMASPRGTSSLQTASQERKEHQPCAS